MGKIESYVAHSLIWAAALCYWVYRITETFHQAW